MRLLHIISSVDPRGGGPIEGIRQRGLFLTQLGHTVEVLCVDDPAAPHVARFPLPVHALGPSKSGYAYGPGLKQWLQEHAHRYDHIVINGLWQYHGIAAAKVLQRLGKPYHVFTHGMLDPWFRDTYPLKHLKKSVYWLLAEGRVLNHARRVFFTSEEERLRARSAFWPYRVCEQVVPYGTTSPPEADPEAMAQLYERHPALKGKHLLLFLSRVHLKKGCDLLLEAYAQVAAQHAHIHLVIAGPGDADTLAWLHRLADRLGLTQRVTWIDMVQGDAKWALFRAANAFVLPSHQENFGISVAEALGCGVPVLISDKVNIWREIEADGAGLVAPDTVAGTLKTLERWLALSAEEQAVMAQAATACFQRRYTVKAMALGLLEALEAQEVGEGGQGGTPTMVKVPAANGSSAAQSPADAQPDEVHPLMRRTAVDAGRASMIRILHVVTSVDPATGGVVESIRARGVRLQALGHHVEVACLDAPGAPGLADFPLPLHVLGPGLTRWCYSSRLVPWLRANVQRFDAVIVDGIWQYHGLAVRRALAGTGIPYYVFPHGMLDPWFKRTYPLKHLKKWMVWPWADYRVLRDARAVLFTCEEEREAARQSFWLYQVRPIIVPFGTASPPADAAASLGAFRAAFPALAQRQLLTYLGRVHPKKGCDLLIQAFASVAPAHPAVDLAIAGPGEPGEFARLKALVAECGIANRVHWLGMLRGPQKWGALHAALAFVLPSHQENFGIAVAEAMACARPVLITNKVNIWREVQAGGGGLVVDDTLAGVHGGLTELLSKPASQLADMGQQAAHTFERHFTVDAMARGLVDVVEGRAGATPR